MFKEATVKLTKMAKNFETLNKLSISLTKRLPNFCTSQNN
jgi:hypothetical protein